MSYAVKDTVGGKRIEVVYGAAHLPLPGGSGRWQRARVVRDHLSHNRSKYALVVRGAGGLDIWWAAETQGISFAAAIESWFLSDLGSGGSEDEEDGEDGKSGTGFGKVEESAEGDAGGTPEATGSGAVDYGVSETLVAVPLDERIYLADVEGGVVRNERVLPPEQAEAQMNQATAEGTIVYFFQASVAVGKKMAVRVGKTAEMVQVDVELEEPPFDLCGYRFRPAWRVFARHGMFHPSHAIAVTVLSIFIGLALMSGPIARNTLDRLSWVAGGAVGDFIAELVNRWWPDDMPAPVPAEPPRQVTPRVAHSAAGDLRLLIRHLTMAESFHADGLQRLTMNGSEAVYNGIAADRTGTQQWPTRVFHASAGKGEEVFGIGSSGWALRVPHPPTTEAGKTPGVSSDDVMKTMMGSSMPVRFNLVGGPEVIPVWEDRVENTVTLPLKSTTWSATVDIGVIGSLADQADWFGRMPNLPGELVSAECGFGEWRIRSCVLSLRIDSL